MGVCTEAEIEHSRKEFKGTEYIQVFLLHDFQTKGTSQSQTDSGPLQFIFARHNPNLVKYFRVSNAFTVDECMALRNSNFELARVSQRMGQILKFARARFTGSQKLCIGSQSTRRL
jgi:hypothetical protein